MQLQSALPTPFKSYFNPELTGRFFGVGLYAQPMAFVPLNELLTFRAKDTSPVLELPIELLKMGYRTRETNFLALLGNNVDGIYSWAAAISNKLHVWKINLSLKEQTIA